MVEQLVWSCVSAGPEVSPVVVMRILDDLLGLEFDPEVSGKIHITFERLMHPDLVGMRCFCPKLPRADDLSTCSGEILHYLVVLILTLL